MATMLYTKQQVIFSVLRNSPSELVCLGKNCCKGQTSPAVILRAAFALRACKGIQVRAYEQHKQRICIFIQTAIHRFAVAELALDDPENILHLAACGGLAMLDPAFPIN